MRFHDDMNEPPEPPLVDPVAFERFTRDLHGRLEAGARQYGCASFERPPGELLEELRQEALDLAGWGYVLSVRIERLQRQVGAADHQDGTTDP